MKFAFFASKQSTRIRQASKSGLFGINPDIITGAAAVLATFAYQAILHQPSATISIPTVRKTIPSIPATPTSTLPPSKTTYSPSTVENGSPCTLIAGGIILVLAFVGIAAVVATRIKPGTKGSNGDGDFEDTNDNGNSNNITTAHDDDPDPNSPGGGQNHDDGDGSKDDSDDDEDSDEDNPNDSDDDIDEVERLLNEDDDSDDEDIEEVESFLNGDDGDDDDPPDDPPPPSSDTDTPDDKPPSRLSRFHPFLTWFFGLCSILAELMAYDPSGSLYRRTPAALLNDLRKLRRSLNETSKKTQDLVRRMKTKTPVDLVAVHSCNHSPKALPRRADLEASTTSANSLMKIFALIIINGWSVATTLRYKLDWKRVKAEELLAATDDRDGEDEDQNLATDASESAREAAVHPADIPLPDDHEDDFNFALWVPLPDVDECEFDPPLYIPLPEDHEKDFDMALWIPLPDVDEREFDLSFCIPLPEDNEDDFNLALWIALPDVDEREFDPPLYIPLPEDHENDFEMALWTPLPDVDEREFDSSLCVPLPEDGEDDFNLALWVPLPDVDEREFDLSLCIPLPEDHENDFNMALWIPLPDLDEREFDLSLCMPLPDDDEDDFNMSLWVPLPAVDECEFDLSLHVLLPEDNEDDFNMALWVPLPVVKSCEFDLCLSTPLPEDNKDDLDMAYWIPLPTDDGGAFDVPAPVEPAPVVTEQLSTSITSDVFNVPTPVESAPGVAPLRQPNMDMVPRAPVLESRTYSQQPNQPSPLFTPRPLQRSRQPIPINTPFNPHASHMQPVQQPQAVMVFFSPSPSLQRPAMRPPTLPVAPISSQPLHFFPHNNFNLSNASMRQDYNPNAGAVTPCPPRQPRPGRMMSRVRPSARSESPPRPIAIIRPSPSFEERHRIETEREARRVREEREAARKERERLRNEEWKRIQEERQARQKAREAAERKREARRERQARPLVCLLSLDFSRCALKHLRQVGVPAREGHTPIASTSAVVNDGTGCAPSNHLLSTSAAPFMPCSNTDDSPPITTARMGPTSRPRAATGSWVERHASSPLMNGEERGIKPSTSG
ncbi:hypothetical protein C0995_006696 [Termitomyces sp. Mi166|nr:hypothetical protein C0995_006696 [Termitomyces sp. Mi166\